MIFTALSPNTQKDDFSLALKSLLKSSEYSEGESVYKLKDWFRQFFRVKYVSCYESARTSLYFILKQVGIKEGDEILLQAFTCVAATNPIKWAKAKPVFVDIDPKNFNMDFDDLVNKVTEKTKCIIVQHTFGYPADIERIVNFAREKGIKVVEDCAHTIGTEFNGKKLGTFGDASIFSLGRDKAISASFGGVVITNYKDIGKKLEERETFLSFPSNKWIRRQILYTIIAYLTRSMYGIYIGKLIHFLAFKFQIIGKSTTQAEKKTGEMPEHAKSRMPNVFAKLALNQLNKIDYINSKRQEFYNLYLKRLSKIPSERIRLPEWNIKKNFYPLRLPLVVEKRDELMKFAQSKGVLLGDWYNVPVAPKEVDQIATGYKSGSCIHVEETCKKIVNLPLHVNLEESDILKVISIIREFYS